MRRRMYWVSSAKKDDFAALIAASEKMYAEKLVAAYSEENAQALVDQKAALEAMAVEFKAAIDYTVIVDIDFGTTEAPAAFETHTTEPDSLGETTTYNTIAGAKGVMTFNDLSGSYPYALGWGSATDETTGAVIATDSLGMLRVGNSEAVVEFAGAPVAETDIVNIKFDFYAGKLNKAKVGYKVLAAEGDTICGLYYSPYDGNDDMNTFGRKFRVSIFGESHGELIGVVMDGVPAGLELSEQDFEQDILRRKSGAKGTTPRIEADRPMIVSGVFEGHTTGAPLTVTFKNTNTHSSDYELFAAMPRPGHADLTAALKWDDCQDPRGGGHFSGRLTLPVVAAGVVARKILQDATLLDETPFTGVSARIVELGGIPAPDSQSDYN